MATIGNSAENQLSKDGGGSGRNATEDENDDDHKLSPEFSSKLNINLPETIEIGSDSDNDSLVKPTSEQSRLVKEKVLYLQKKRYASLVNKAEKHSNKDTESDVKGNNSTSSYKCDCGESFEKSTELAAHKRWTCKQSEKTVQCSICKSCFVHERGLKRHMKHAHHGVFDCSECSLRFHSLIKLSRHWMESHYDENKTDDKLKCFLCGDESFPSKFDLESHLLNHKYNKMIIKRSSVTESGRTLINLAQNVSGNVDGDRNEITGSRATNKANSSFYSQTKDENVAFQSPSQSASSSQDRSLCSSPNQPNIENCDSTTGTFLDHHFPPHIFHPRFPGPRHHPAFHPPFPGCRPFHHHPPRHPPPHHHLPHRHRLHHPHCLPCHQPPPPPSNPDPPDHATPPTCSESQETPFSHHFPFPHWPDRRRHHEHHKKMKWKRYYKNLMSQYLSPWAMGQYVTSPADLPTQAETTTESSTVPKGTSPTIAPESQNQASFRMACKFCGQILDRGTAVHHRLHDCPALSFTFKCNVCGRAFKKYHKLIQHRVRQGHFERASDDQTPGGYADSLTQLQNQLHAVGISSTTGRGTPVSSPHATKSWNDPTAKLSHPGEIDDQDGGPVGQEDIADSPPLVIVETEPDAIESKNEFDMEEETKKIVDEEHVTLIDRFECSVCHVVLESAALLSLHLQEHITHVTAVVKVQEWKQKSSKYFYDTFGEESPASSTISGTDSPFDASSTATDVSFQDTSSAQLSSVSSAVLEQASGVADTINSSEKWLKPHCKKKKIDGKTIFPCEFCTQTFAFKKALRFHLKEKHGQKKPHLECPVCQRKFSWKSRSQFYERHLNSHYGIKIFKHKCDVCGKTFLEKSKLQAHVTVKHSSDLVHMCNICGKGYGSKSSLTRHIRQHTGEKPHQCEVCSESFLEKRELLRHMAVHTGSPAFMCPYCDQGFTLKTSLDTHIKRKHQNQPLHTS